MGQIFISYSRRDTQIVDRIAASMKDAGLDFWIDREDIKAGNTWRVQIVQAIDTCDAFVLMLSPNSAASDNVRKEIDLGQDSGRKMFVVMLEPTDLPAEIRYQLAGLQFIDVKMVGYDKAGQSIDRGVEGTSRKDVAHEPKDETGRSCNSGRRSESVRHRSAGKTAGLHLQTCQCRPLSTENRRPCGGQHSCLHRNATCQGLGVEDAGVEP